MVKQKHKSTKCGKFELVRNKNISTGVNLMPEIIIEQNKDIINYINMLKLPYSEAIQNHMVGVVKKSAV